LNTLAHKRDKWQVQQKKMQEPSDPWINISSCRSLEGQNETANKIQWSSLDSLDWTELPLKHAAAGSHISHILFYNLQILPLGFENFCLVALN